MLYKIGDRVLINNPHNRFTSYQMGCVTGISSPHAILINGMPRHVKDHRPTVGSITSVSDTHITSITSSESAKVFGSASNRSNTYDSVAAPDEQYYSSEIESQEEEVVPYTTD